MNEVYKKWPVNIRFDGSMKESIEHTANNMGVEVPTLVKNLVKAFVEQYEEHEGRLPWPPKFQHYEHNPVAVFKPHEIKARKKPKG